MTAAIEPARPRGVAALFAWPRVKATLITASVFGLIVGAGWRSSVFSGYIRVLALGLMSMVVFGVFEQWPRALPRWLARWVLQVVAVAFAIPWATFFIYVASTAKGAPAFWHDADRMGGYSLLTGLGLLLCPWIALGSLVRQKEAFAREQALAFELERSELERQALDARLHLLKAQVSPHFLFNTLANVQQLVDTGSPQASSVLRSLIAYLRAAVPRLDDPATTVGHELALVQAYLELMHMRMPDRLSFAIDADADARALRCPPMTLMTLVENAVRHGIDPSEEGGRIEIRVERRGERCRVRVSDTGVGLQASSGGLGTGLSALRERLALVFGDGATLKLSGQAPHGVVAELEFPAREGER